MKTLVIILFMAVALAGHADERKMVCYTGDYVVNDMKWAEILQRVSCIEGDLVWNLSFGEDDELWEGLGPGQYGPIWWDPSTDHDGHLDMIGARNLVYVTGEIMVSATYAKLMYFPLLEGAELIDVRLAGMMGCDHLFYWAQHAGDTPVAPYCKGGYLP